jgi:GMP synthase (glutamine-hydrolysing)
MAGGAEESLRDHTPVWNSVNSVAVGVLAGCAMSAPDVLAVRHVAFEDLGVLEPLLTARGFRVDYLDAGTREITPERLTAPDLLVVLGGPVGVYDAVAYPFLEPEIAAVGARLATRRPTLGVCLGAQVMALALGADVHATGRHEIGYAPLTLTEAGRTSVLRPIADVPVLHWHGDEFEIPDAAARLAATPGFPNQAFALGDWALALQFHLENDPTRIEQWLVGHSHELAAVGVAPETIRDDAARHGPALATAATRVFTEWLDKAFGSTDH